MRPDFQPHIFLIHRVVHLDLGPEAEGSQGGPRAEEEEVRLPQGVQALRQQQVDHPREQRRVDTHRSTARLHTPNILTCSLLNKHFMRINKS